MKKVIKLTEGDLSNIVKRIIKEDAEESMGAQKVEKIIDSPKVQFRLEDIVSNLSEREKMKIKDALNQIGIDEYTSAKDAHSAVKDLADEAMSGEMSEEDENESPKERIAKVLHNIGAGNISAWGGIPAAILIGSMTGFPLGLAISWGTTGLLMGLARILGGEGSETQEA